MASGSGVLGEPLEGAFPEAPTEDERWQKKLYFCGITPFVCPKLGSEVNGTAGRSIEGKDEMETLRRVLQD